MTSTSRTAGVPAIPGPGTPAPVFELRSAPDRVVRLSDLRGRPVVLAFCPADWSPVCGDQLTLYNEVLDEFTEHGAQLLGISVDGRAQRREWHADVLHRRREVRRHLDR